MLFSPYCREFNSLQKRYTALLHRTNTFSENKKIRSVVGGKVDGQIFAGTRSEKSKIFAGTKLQFPKFLFCTKLQFPKILFGSQRVKSLIYYYIKCTHFVKSLLNLLNSGVTQWCRGWTMSRGPKTGAMPRGPKVLRVCKMMWMGNDHVWLTHYVDNVNKWHATLFHIIYLLYFS